MLIVNKPFLQVTIYLCLEAMLVNLLSSHPYTGEQSAAGLDTAFFSVRYVPFFKRNVPFFSVLFRSFFEFLGTYEIQKNVPFVSVLF